MITSSYKRNTVKCKLELPYFEAEHKDEQKKAELMNRFTLLLADKITSYTEEKGSHVRTYTADFSVDTTDKITLVNIRLSARILSPSEGIRFRKREISCRWKGTRLSSVENI